MSKRHPLDELFKQNLREASAPVPDNMWERIARARQQKKRRLLVVWSTVGATTLGLLAILLFPASSPELGYFPLDFEGNGGVSTALATQGTSNTSVSDMTDMPVVSSPAFPTETATKSESRNSSLAASLASSQVSKILAENPKTVSSTFATTSAAIEQTEENTLAIATSDASPDSDDESPKIAGPHQRLGTKVVAQLPMKGQALAELGDLKLFANHAPRCARFANPFFRFDLEVLGGPAYAQQILRAKNPESVDHLMKRKSSESTGLSYSSGFRIAASSSVGLRFSSGLMYTQVKDRFTFEMGSRLIEETIFGSNGEIVGYDTTLVEAFQDTRSNRLSFVEVPILLGYEGRLGKFRVGVNAGAFLNLHFKAKGSIFSPATGEPIEFGQEGDRNVLPIFEQRTTAAWYAGLSLAYNLHSRYSVIAEPYFKSYPKALSSSAYDLQQNYWMAGLQLGMRMRL